MYVFESGISVLSVGYKYKIPKVTFIIFLYLVFYDLDLGMISDMMVNFMCHFGPTDARIAGKTLFPGVSQ